MTFRVISPDTEAVSKRWNIPALPAAAIAASNLTDEQIQQLLDPDRKSVV